MPISNKVFLFINYTLRAGWPITFDINPTAATVLLLACYRRELLIVLSHMVNAHYDILLIFVSQCSSPSLFIVAYLLHVATATDLSVLQVLLLYSLARPWVLELFDDFSCLVPVLIHFCFLCYCFLLAILDYSLL